VQAWVNGEDNFGWAILPWNGGTDGMAISPSESADPAVRPTLVVNWVPADTMMATFQDGGTGYTGTVDTRLVAGNADGDYSTDTTLWSDADGDDPWITSQFLLRFDYLIGEAMSQVPAGATIHAAVLETASVASNSVGDGGTFHTMLTSWSDADTWNTMVDGITPDDVEASASPFAQAGFARWQSRTLRRVRAASMSRPTCRRGLTAAADNYGWAVVPFASRTDGWGIQSSEYGTEEFRPELRIYYSSDAAKAVADEVAVAQDAGATAVDVLANDMGAGLSITGVSQGSQGGAVTTDGAQLEYTPAAGFVGQEAFTYTMTDGVDTLTTTVIATVGTPEHAYLDLSGVSINSYGGPDLDVVGLAEIQAGGNQLYLTGNLLKAIDLNYKVTPYTVLEFDFRSSTEGEIHAIGTDLSEIGLQVYGTESVGFPELEDYASTAPDFQHYQVRLGDYVQGDMTQLLFMNNEDVANPTSNSFFANIRLTESALAPQIQDDIIGRVSSNGDWWVATSDGTSFTNEKVGSWSNAMTWETVVSGDFNDDGVDDLAGRDAITGDWYVSTLSGGSLVTEKWGTWSNAVTWQHVQVGDFNGDGMDDLVGQVSGSGEWWLAKSTGTGFENEKWGRWSTGTGVTWVDVQLGDFNGDGNADLAGRVSESGEWWVSASTGSSFATSNWGRWSPSVDWINVHAGDFNGDGSTDLVGRVSSTGDWWVTESTGSSFTNVKWGRWSSNADWINVSVGDFNGDGYSDLVGRVSSTGDWWVAESNGSSFGNAKWGRWSAGTTWIDVQLGDFNADGSLDIAGRTSSTGDWWVAKSEGTSFTNERWGRWSTAVDWLDIQIGNMDGVPSDGGVGGVWTVSGRKWVRTRTTRTVVTCCTTSWWTTCSPNDELIVDIDLHGLQASA
jgi:hypothetical protein